MTTDMIRDTALVALTLVGSLACTPDSSAQQGLLGNTLGGKPPQKILSPDLEPGDIFGAAVSIDGDVMLLGAEYDDDNGIDSGSVWVYRYSKDSWKPEQKLKPSDGQAGDNFGRAVSVRGDVALIGAHWDDDKGNNAGSAYVFRYDGATWMQEQKLTAPDGATQDRFGATLALSGNRLLVGAWLDDDDGNASGAVYSYRFDGSAWIPEQKLTASDAGPNAQFARYVSMSRDVALIGAWHDDEQGADAGAAYIFRHDGAKWVETQKLLPGDVGPGDEFGWATSLDGDVAIVGAHGDDQAGTDAGAVYVFRDSNGSFLLEQKVLADDAAPFNQLGYSIAVRGEQMLLGAKVAMGSANEVGKAYVVRHDRGSWKQTRVLEPPDGMPGDAFAFHLDMDGSTFVVGAWRHVAGVGFQAGAVYVWTDPGLDTDRFLKK